jgi:hypothetical protein
MPIEPPTPDVKKFTTKGLAEAFNLIDMALAKLESMDPNTERFENVAAVSIPICLATSHLR